TSEIAAPMAAVPCLELGPVDERAGLQLLAGFDEVAPGVPIQLRRLEETTSYVVFVPPADTLAEAQRRLGELRRSGLEDVYLFGDGAFRNAISLGLYRTRDAAAALQRSLQQRGIIEARVAPRGPGQGRLLISLLEPAPELLAELQRLHAAGSAIDVRPCAATLTAGR
ncbi:MAG TPA: hypothetical protein VM491_20300, partial [Burkholderiaceae bacterium]|nr:hypothetical protein [Burkholderiaceae bacterium]